MSAKEAKVKGDPGGDTRTLEKAPAVRSGVVRLAAAWMILPLFFLLAGGSLRWWEAWLYCLAILVPMSLFFFRTVSNDPGFLARRFKAGEKEPVQRLIVALGGAFLLVALVVPGLGHRFGWPHPPVAVVVAALGIALASYVLILRVFDVNRWAGRTVETYPGQEVVRTGPYAIVRHPMYAASAVFYLASPVALGSWWGLLPALGAVAMFVPRILNEERVLVRDLPGYDEYRRDVRYRLVPFVW